MQDSSSTYHFQCCYLLSRIQKAVNFSKHDKTSVVSLLMSKVNDAQRKTSGLKAVQNCLVLSTDNVNVCP